MGDLAADRVLEAALRAREFANITPDLPKNILAIGCTSALSMRMEEPERLFEVLACASIVALGKTNVADHPKAQGLT